jgi:hypothetical protein
MWRRHRQGSVLFRGSASCEFCQTERRNVISRFLTKIADKFPAMNFRDRLWPAKRGRIFENYEERYPSHQNAIDVVPGWNSTFPPQLGLKAGTLPLFADERIKWAIERYGNLSGRLVLELGALEAGHTSMLHAAGANVIAIEANKLAFLRCLVAKEILGLTNARFYLGDFVKWLEMNETNYDLIVASGVLYHMRDPLRLLRAMAQRTGSIYLWTVCVTNEALVPAKTELLNGIPMRLYWQTYARTESNTNFCGGMEDRHYWLHRDDILAGLKALGFTSLTIAHDEPDHLFGPCFSVFAKKPDAAARLETEEKPAS